MINISLRKGFLIFVGTLATTLAVIGVVLPLFPATPFLLLAAACFIRSSDRFYKWLITVKWFGPYVKGYREYSAVTKRAKVVIFLLLWISLGYSTIWVANSLVVRLLLVLIGIGVTIHVLSLKTLTAELISKKDGAGPDT